MHPLHPIYVLAGSFTEFKAAKRFLTASMYANNIEFASQQIRYISSPDVLRGVISPWGYRLGRYEMRRDFPDIVDMIAARGSSLEDFIELEYTMEYR